MLIQNPHLDELDEDYLYHLGLDTENFDLDEMFGDVKFVCMGGTPHRMEEFANLMMEELGYHPPTGTCLTDIAKHSHRYALYKVGPVLCVSHGMGVPSLSILLHEMIKLMAHSGVEDPIFIRIGTCGGVGYSGGIVAISREGVDGKLRPVYDNVVLGHDVHRPAKLDQNLADELFNIAKESGYHVIQGKTVCTNDFYEGQGRLDGAICGYSKKDKMNYLEWLKNNGVINIEMECVCFAAMTLHCGIRAAIVCVTLVNRMEDDQLRASPSEMEEWQIRPLKVVSAFIKKKLKEEGINLPLSSSRTTENQEKIRMAYVDKLKPHHIEQVSLD